MKTATNNPSLGIKIQLIILLLLLLAFITNLSGSTISIADIPNPGSEATVNDIPFDTREIAVDYFFEKAMSGVEVQADTAVNDIPFNTALIRELNHKRHAVLLPLLTPEQDVNDIPFDTHKIAQEYRFSQINTSLALTAECSVYDFPFETTALLSQFNIEKKSTATFNLADNLPDHVFNRLVNLVKAGLISILILLSAGILGFLFFSYVY